MATGLKWRWRPAAWRAGGWWRLKCSLGWGGSRRGRVVGAQNQIGWGAGGEGGGGSGVG